MTMTSLTNMSVDTALRPADRAATQTSGVSPPASLAELYASIVHEVNQPLAAVIANAHACQRWLSADPPNMERARLTAERIVRDANSTLDIIGALCTLFRRDRSERSAANINDVIMDVCRLMADESRTGRAEVAIELSVGLPPVLMDRVLIRQVLVNLIRNAIEALESGGQGSRRVCIRSHRVATDRLCVEVIDWGAGLDDVERVFEPFFTTKPKGMGIGLTICRSIVEAHDGRLWAQSNDPVGTRFVFTLPIRGAAQT
jgi:signal transduction histidine kinase